MSESTIKDVFVVKQKIIDVPDGNVLHIMKFNDVGYSGFGEAYFSTINCGTIKGWKRHNEMTLNIVVPLGEIKFVLFDDRNKYDKKQYQEINLSKDNYNRITIPPGVWLAFQGVSEGSSLLLNIANILHDPEEVDKKHIDEIKYGWSK